MTIVDWILRLTAGIAIVVIGAVIANAVSLVLVWFALSRWCKK